MLSAVALALQSTFPPQAALPVRPTPPRSVFLRPLDSWGSGGSPSLGGLPRTLLCVQRGFPAPPALGRDLLHPGATWRTQCLPTESSVSKSPRQGSRALSHGSPPRSRLSWAQLQGLCGWRDCSSSGGSGSMCTPLGGNGACGTRPLPGMASSLLLSVRRTRGEERLGSREAARGAAREGICVQLGDPRSPASHETNAGSCPPAPFASRQPASGSTLSQP